ncbi:hypothetical protein NDU88_005476 [Pleurodeles waltl]|uniref:Uncharacterized protein n=1 Tax=Pleurodeles waltl TaxID=8319 RepID=A0AAV7NML4_PLEWA|nr:hypothetical protein NDU88_005476 [Pleurodeles waltl]
MDCSLREPGEPLDLPQTPPMRKVRRKKDPKRRGEIMEDPLKSHHNDPQMCSLEQTGDPTLQDILHAITASRETLESKIDSLAMDMTILRNDKRHLAKGSTRRRSC